MKKLDIILKSEKLDDLKAALNEIGVKGLIYSVVKGYGNSQGYDQLYRGQTYTTDLLTMVKAEVVVKEDMFELAKDTVVKAVKTGVQGDGKIFVYDVYEVIKISTGEKDEDALV